MSGAALRVLFICDFPPGFDGAAYHGPGVGGTEAVVVLLAEALAERGMEVTVGTRVARASNHAGVRYLPVAGVGGGDHDLAILVKHWSDAADGRGRTKLFLMTDVHVPDPESIARCRAWAARSLALSEYQRRRVEAVVGRGWLHVLGAPIGVEEYAASSAPRDNILVYCSVPDRGLFYLRDIFPRVRRRVPDAKLVITSDLTLWGLSPAREAFLRFFEGVDGVEYLGHVPRDRLVAEQQRAKVMAYPCNFEEGFCLAAGECMAAGTVPVTTNAFALTTTVGAAGVLVRGRPWCWFYRRAFASAVVRLLTDDGEWSTRSQQCRTHALTRYRPGLVADGLLRAALEAPR